MSTFPVPPHGADRANTSNTLPATPLATPAPRAARRRTRRPVSWAGLAGAAVLLVGCGALPSLEGRSASQAMEDTQHTRLGRAVQPQADDHPGLSGIATLANGRDAFATRALLARIAERSLDVQYYIWRDDMAGQLLFDTLRQAADRGVRVRLLLDDNGTAGLDETLAALDAHPHIEVRLFNPFVQRRWRMLGFVTDFDRANRRMHNKSFTVDNQATVVGGRNVGNEYFGAEAEALFVDLDLLAVGPVVREVSRDFDRYWASDSSYALASVLSLPESRAYTAPAASAAAHTAPGARAYLEAVAGSPFVQELLTGQLVLHWAPVTLVSDDPAKGLGRATDENLLMGQMMGLLQSPTRELQLISPYFVPTARGTEIFSALARRGVQVSVLTNALEATDVPAVHAGYAKRRKPLLEAGVRLYEMKRSQADATTSKGSGDEHGLGLGLSSSSSSSLHAKTFAVDGQQLFVGSFNFDPRSARLNTEMGFVVHSPLLAGQMAAQFQAVIPARAYTLQLGPQGQLQWQDPHPAAGAAAVLEQEPGAGFWRRLMVRVMSWLPIEGLL